ncbi:hypothetical protein EI94DRAFT_105130 [Lactarius quietus]|nr:hypothetical protein EI94DRAFT_105130 [Lactarius quietus]
MASEKRKGAGAKIKEDNLSSLGAGNKQTETDAFQRGRERLSSRTRMAITHSIQEQVHTYQKSLFLDRHPLDGPLCKSTIFQGPSSPITSIA